MENKVMELANQKLAILNYMYAGKTITQLEALDMFGCMRLASRIRDLRDDGHIIRTDMKTNGTKRWAQYALEKINR
jgi:hypothetical protein